MFQNWFEINNCILFEKNAKLAIPVKIQDGRRYHGNRIVINQKERQIKFLLSVH